ncbi:hypothetical protein [Paenibacillus pini]|nr:hypothetical protein [Paenibacillus pini]
MPLIYHRNHALKLEGIGDVWYTSKVEVPLIVCTYVMKENINVNHEVHAA